MSILRVANLQFNASGTRRIDYDPVADDGIIKVSAAAVKLPVGDNASRPASQAGIVRYNSDTGYMEFGGATSWVPVASNAAFDVANLAYTMANVAYNAQNVDYTLSNTAFGVANAAYNFSNAAYASINSNWTVTNTVYGVANTALQNTNGVTTSGALNIPGNLKVYRGTNAGGTFNLGDGTSSWTIIGNQINGGDLLFKDPSNSTVMYFSQSGGSVGIGNTTPGPAKVHITSANTVGGTGYADFLRVTNASYPAITNPVKTFRLNQTGGIEIINNAYTAVIASLDDSGNFATGSRGISKASMPAGSILQIVQTVISSATTINTNTTAAAVSGYAATITPTSSTSKIWILCQISYGTAGGVTTYGGYFARNGTAIGIGDVGSGQQRIGFGLDYTGDGNQVRSIIYSYIDSPASTSALTYQMWVNNDNNNTLYLNRSASDQGNVTGKRGITTITLLEIAV